MSSDLTKSPLFKGISMDLIGIDSVGLIMSNAYIYRYKKCNT
ncbi:hypothetical protein GPLA_2275 [Paraglaciecola polaris LMG 21857]|uniref:Uncharacterized protein n=1 Tax=Paraglaciecola polaris LMG 21857 TaxID=1129793 RepID=K7ACV4_9ALTE|nr:hypothetical protein GPLA_2275 [Paraglaciecola polaris LMG 21857]